MGTPHSAPDKADGPEHIDESVTRFRSLPPVMTPEMEALLKEHRRLLSEQGLADSDPEIRKEYAL